MVVHTFIFRKMVKFCHFKITTFTVTVNVPIVSTCKYMYTDC